MAVESTLRGRARHTFQPLCPEAHTGVDAHVAVRVGVRVAREEELEELEAVEQGKVVVEEEEEEYGTSTTRSPVPTSPAKERVRAPPQARAPSDAVVAVSAGAAPLLLLPAVRDAGVGGKERRAAGEGS